MENNRLNARNLRVALILLSTQQLVEGCNLTCPENLIFDLERCECIPIPWRECHPLYGKQCDQFEYDESKGRQPFNNPFTNETWYEDSAELPIIGTDCGDL